MKVVNSDPHDEHPGTSLKSCQLQRFENTRKSVTTVNIRHFATNFHYSNRLQYCHSHC